MAAMNFFAFALLLIAAAAAVTEQSTDCVNIQPMSNAQTSRFSGTWMAVRALNYNNEYSCLKENIQVDDDGVFQIEATIKLSRNNQTVNYTATGTPVEGDRATISYRTSYDAENSFIGKIVDTDYDNYVIWSTCKYPLTQEIAILVMTRLGSPLSEQTLDTVKQTLRAKNVDDQLIPIDQENC